MLLRSTIVASAALLCATLAASPGHAANLFVSSNGTGVTCNQSFPCATLSTALSAAGVGDLIICISPPQVGELLSITKSVTIDCSGNRAMLHSLPGSPIPAAVSINITGQADLLRIVRLRGLTIDGSGSVLRSINRGIDIQSASAVYIEDCVVANNAQQGIFDHRTGGQTKLFIKDSFVGDNGGAGIVAVSAAVGITVLDNVTSQNNTYGIAVGTGNNVSIKNSVFSGNSVAGVEGDAGSHIMISNSAVTHNNIGIQSSTSVRFFSNDISFNNTAFSGLAATSGLNRYDANVSIGTAPSPVPNAPADIGP